VEVQGERSLSCSFQNASCLSDSCLQPFFLPDSKVCILDGSSGSVMDYPLRRLHTAQKAPGRVSHGPAVRGNVMHGQKQYVILCFSLNKVALMRGPETRLKDGMLFARKLLGLGFSLLLRHVLRSISGRLKKAAAGAIL